MPDVSRFAVPVPSIDPGSPVNWDPLDSAIVVDAPSSALQASNKPH